MVLDIKIWYVYLLRCSNDSIYCGISNDISKRLKQHNGNIAGGAKYTRANSPCVLVYQEGATDRSAALRREYEIKKMNHNDKLLLIKSYAPILLQKQ